MAKGSSKSMRAKAQRQAGAAGFRSRPMEASDSENSDADWVDDKSEGVAEGDGNNVFIFPPKALAAKDSCISR